MSSSLVNAQTLSARTLKTSRTHPLNISWLLPPSMISKPVKRSASLYVDNNEMKNNQPSLSSEKRKLESINDDGIANGDEVEENGLKSEPIIVRITTTSEADLKKLIALEKSVAGNLALSSLPGKKVRLALDASLLKRSPVSRDLDADFARIRDHGIKAIVNLLDDEELSYLNAPWEVYKEKAELFGLEIIRFPIAEGGCPPDIETFEKEVMEPIQSRTIKRGFNVLVHCRGGIGRAGLVACCWLLKNGFCTTPVKAIKYVRLRRSLKAIETTLQEDFIHNYDKYLEQSINDNDDR